MCFGFQICSANSGQPPSLDEARLLQLLQTGVGTEDERTLAEMGVHDLVERFGIESHSDFSAK